MTAPDLPRLREPANLVCPRARWWWLIGGIGQAIVLAGLQVGWWFFDRRDARGPHVVVAVVVGVLVLGYLIVMPIWRYRVHRWEVTATAVYTQTGWISQERRIAPLSRVQTVDLTRGPVAQLLRLATVRVTTASAAGHVVIHGLDRDDAATLVERLTAAAAAERGDAT
jgi:membrane protein YdbS with pleckstrin-like domain